MQHKLECSMAEVNAKYQHLEEAEKHALRQALIEERSRFCHFITCLKPFVVSDGGREGGGRREGKKCKEDNHWKDGKEQVVISLPLNPFVVSEGGRKGGRKGGRE